MSNEIQLPLQEKVCASILVPLRVCALLPRKGRGVIHSFLNFEGRHQVLGTGMVLLTDETIQGMDVNSYPLIGLLHWLENYSVPESAGKSQIHSDALDAGKEVSR